MNKKASKECRRKAALKKNPPVVAPLPPNPPKIPTPKPVPVKPSKKVADIEDEVHAAVYVEKLIEWVAKINKPDFLGVVQPYGIRTWMGTYGLVDRTERFGGLTGT